MTLEITEVGMAFVEHETAFLSPKQLHPKVWIKLLQNVLLQKVSLIKIKKLIFCWFLFWNYLNKHESVTLSPIDSWVNVRDFNPMLLMIIVLTAMFLCSAFSWTAFKSLFLLLYVLQYCLAHLKIIFCSNSEFLLSFCSKTMLCCHIIFWRTPSLDSSIISVYLKGWHIIVYFRSEKINEHSRNIRDEWWALVSHRYNFSLSSFSFKGRKNSTINIFILLYSVKI